MLSNDDIKRLMLEGNVSTLKIDGEKTLTKALAWSKKKIIGFQRDISLGKEPIELGDFFSAVISEAGSNEIDEEFILSIASKFGQTQERDSIDELSDSERDGQSVANVSSTTSPVFANKEADSLLRVSVFSRNGDGTVTKREDVDVSDTNAVEDENSSTGTAEDEAEDEGEGDSRGETTNAKEDDEVSTASSVPGAPRTVSKKSKGFQLPASKSKPFLPPANGNASITSGSVSPDEKKPVKKAHRVIKKAASSVSTKSKFDVLSKSKASRKKIKVEGEPKRALSAYNLFSQKMRPQIVANTTSEEEKKPTAIMVALGTMWKALSTDERKEFEDAAAMDKIRFQEEKTRFLKENPHAYDHIVPSSKKKSSKDKTKKKKTKKPIDSSKASSMSQEEADSSRSSSRRKANTKRVKYNSDVDDDDDDLESSDEDEKAAVVVDSKKSALRKTKSNDKVSLSSVASLKGIKQKDLPATDDLLNSHLIFARAASVEGVDYHPALEENVTLVVTPYRDFLNSLSSQNIVNLDISALESVLQANGSSVRGVVKSIHPVFLPSGDDEKESNSAASTNAYQIQLHCVKDNIVYTVLYVPYSSDLLITDSFLMSTEQYAASLKKPFLLPGSQIRKRFATGEEDNCGDAPFLWMEGSIYEVRKGMKQDPYHSIRVVWLSQEVDTNDWVYAYLQTDNECSPWELEASEFVLPENNIRSQKLPRALMTTRVDAAMILDYFKSLEFVSIFAYKLKEVAPDYLKMFPDESDQLDFPTLTKHLADGRYGGSSASSSSEACIDRNVGIATLFRDLEKMIRHAKHFNECNTSFLPWRQCDMLECTVARTKNILASNHSALTCLSDAVNDQKMNQKEEVVEYGDI